jgi:hypothetical protein
MSKKKQKPKVVNSLDEIEMIFHVHQIKDVSDDTGIPTLGDSDTTHGDIEIRRKDLGKLPVKKKLNQNRKK